MKTYTVNPQRYDFILSHLRRGNGIYETKSSHYTLRNEAIERRPVRAPNAKPEIIVRRLENEKMGCHR